MEQTRFLFTVSVGVILLMLGGVISQKASIGFALLLLGVVLIALGTITRRMMAEDDIHPQLQPIPIRTQDGSTQ